MLSRYTSAIEASKPNVCEVCAAEIAMNGTNVANEMSVVSEVREANF